MRGAGAKPLTRANLPHIVDCLDHQMREAADNLDFELAAALRDQIIELREMSGISLAPPRGEEPQWGSDGRPKRKKNGALDSGGPKRKGRSHA